MLEEIVKEFMGSKQGSGVMSKLEDVGLSPDKAQEAVQATAEGAVKHGGAAGIDVSGLLGGGEGALGAMAGAFGGMGKRASPGVDLSKLSGPVSEYVAQRGFPPGVAEKVVNVVLPTLMALVQKH